MFTTLKAHTEKQSKVVKPSSAVYQRLESGGIVGNIGMMDDVSPGSRAPSIKALGNHIHLPSQHLGVDHNLTITLLVINKPLDHK